MRGLSRTHELGIVGGLEGERFQESNFDVLATADENVLWLDVSDYSSSLPGIDLYCSECVEEVIQLAFIEEFLFFLSSFDFV